MKKLALVLVLILGGSVYQDKMQDDKDYLKIKEFQTKINNVLKKIRPAFVFVGRRGSGVLISADGWALTNHHVAGEEGSHTVYLPNGKSFTAEVYGFDSMADITLLKLEGAKNLPFVELGDVDKVNVGDHCIAIGNPFLLGSSSNDPTITFGVVSAKHVFFDKYSDCIQTDAQINPGNSGGPLFDLNGKLIGINGRIQWRLAKRISTGLGYAISINQIKRYLPEFKKPGKVRRGFLHGVVMAEPDVFENMGEYGDGVLVNSIEEKTPASKAGIEPGDLITHIGGYRTFNLNRFHGVMSNFPPGWKVEIKAKRKDKKGNIKTLSFKDVEVGNPEQTKRLREEKGY